MPPTGQGDTPPEMDAAIPQEHQFRVELPSFEGPLDLLLHLIKKHELDILDLPIAFVTERYLAYLGIMRELNLDVASDYLLMAATLAHIKSKMLLPTVPSDQEDEVAAEPEDPRAELIRRLLEYQKYKLAAEQLGGRSIAGRDVFVRGAPAPEASGPAPLADIGMFKLLDAFEAVLKRVRGKMSLEVSAERITIQERISQITEILQQRRSSEFERLFDNLLTRYEVVVTFLALLEMAKMRMVRVYQAGAGSAIHIQYALLDADDAAEVVNANPITSDDAATAPQSAAPAMSAETVAATTAFESIDPTTDRGRNPGWLSANATRRRQQTRLNSQTMLRLQRLQPWKLSRLKRLQKPLSPQRATHQARTFAPGRTSSRPLRRVRSSQRRGRLR